jgi:hypothetical protein
MVAKAAILNALIVWFTAAMNPPLLWTQWNPKTWCGHWEVF